MQIQRDASQKKSSGNSQYIIEAYYATILQPFSYLFVNYGVKSEKLNFSHKSIYTVYLEK